MKKSNKVHPTISKILEEKLKKVISSGSSLNSNVCIEFYNVIFNEIANLFEKSHITLTNEAMNYIAQMYYDAVSINDTEDGLDPSIFLQRANLKNLETREIALLALMFTNTPFCIPMIAEIKRRS